MRLIRGNKEITEFINKKCSWKRLAQKLLLISLILVVCVAIISVIENPDILWAGDKSTITFTRGWTGQDLYFKVYQHPVRIINKAGIKKYLWPITENIENVINVITTHYNKYKDSSNPAILIMPASGDGIREKPYILRWNDKKQKYVRAKTLPVNKDTVIVHDLRRFKSDSGAYDRNSKEKSRRYMRYQKMAVGIDRFNESSPYNPSFVSWRDEKHPPRNATFKSFRYDGTEFTDERNTIILQFPVIRIPEKYIISGEEADGAHKTKFAVINFTTVFGEKIKADGGYGLFCQADPDTTSIWCIPVDGNTNDVCYRSSYLTKTLD
jgi:hypothetical protein